MLVLGLSQTPFLYHHRLPCLTYLHDHVLKGWTRLSDARRVFVVVNERKHTLD